MSRLLTGVGGVFCAAHLNAEGRMHGHSYAVTAWFASGDALHLQRRLEYVLAEIDHTQLPQSKTLGEQIAVWVGESLPGCVEVEVERPLERIYARWQK